MWLCTGGCAAILRLRLLHRLICGLLLLGRHASLFPYGHLGDKWTATACAAVERCRRETIEGGRLPVWLCGGCGGGYADTYRRCGRVAIVQTMSQCVSMAVGVIVIVIVTMAMLDAAHTLLDRVVFVVAAHRTQCTTAAAAVLLLWRQRQRGLLLLLMLARR